MGNRRRGSRLVSDRPSKRLLAEWQVMYDIAQKISTRDQRSSSLSQRLASLESTGDAATTDFWRLVVRPGPPDSAALQTTQIPSGTSNAIRKRADQYLSDLCSYMPHVDPARVRERVRELAAVYH